MGKDLHAKRPPDACHRGGDPAIPGEPEREPGKLHEIAVPIAEVGGAAPAAFVHGAIVVAGVVRELEQQREDRLSHVGRAVFGHIADGDAAGLRRGHVYDVHPRGQDADVFQFRKPGDRLAGDHRFVREQDLRVASPCDHVGIGGAVVHRAGANRLETRPAQITGIRRIAVEHNNIHAP